MFSLVILISLLRLSEVCHCIRLNGTFTVRKMKYQWIDSPDFHHDCSSFIECLARCSVLSSSENVCNVAHYDNETGTCTMGQIDKLEGSGGQTVRVGLTPYGLGVFNIPLGWAVVGNRAIWKTGEVTIQDALTQCEERNSTLLMGKTLEEISIMYQMCSRPYCWIGRRASL